MIGAIIPGLVCDKLGLKNDARLRLNGKEKKKEGKDYLELLAIRQSCGTASWLVALP